MPLIQDYNKLFEHTDDIKKVIFNGNIVWPTEKPTGPDYTEPFYVENITNNNETLNITKGLFASAPTLTIEYSTDKITWNTLGTTSTTDLTLPLAPGDKVYLRCNTNKWSESFYSNGIKGMSKVGGNIMSLLYGNRFTGEETKFPSTVSGALAYLFNGGYTLQDASKLLLPATTLKKECYAGMFLDCTSLTSSPVLPATTLANSCYSYMFNGCTLLNNITCLATSVITNNTDNWLYGVSSTGTFTKAAGATWPSGANGIPEGWTVVEV